MNEINERNAEYLANQMFYTGFGAIKRDQLHAKMREGKTEFQLVHDVKYGDDSIRAKLNFKKSDQTPNMYFFNSYDLLLKKQNKQETLQMNFPVRRGNNFTLKEGYNLLDGRSVNKNFIRVDRDDPNITQEYSAWTSLDFKELDNNGNPSIKKVYDYDLDKKLNEYPIMGLESENMKKQLMDSLHRGNVHAVMVKTSRGEDKMNIEVAPRFDNINFYDENMKPVTLKSNGESHVKSQGMDNNQRKTIDGNEVQKGRSTKKDIAEKASRKSKGIA